MNDSLANIASRIYAMKIGTRAGCSDTELEFLAEDSFKAAEVFVRVWNRKTAEEENQADLLSRY